MCDSATVGGLLERWRTWRSRHRALRAAAAVTALNEHERQSLSRVCENVALLSYGLSFDDFRVDPRPSEADRERWIVMLDSMHPRGGCVALLKALTEIGPDADGWNVALVGGSGGPWRRMLEPAVRRKGGEARVRFDTADSLDAQRGWLARASLVAAPSLEVTFPLSVMQGLAAGVPVLASNLAAPPGLNGSICVCDPTREAIRQSLRSFLTRSQEECRAAGRTAVGAARAALDWSSVAPHWANLYRELV
jgi:glycosyltransferase involved in cell wall biosynthesis